MNKNIFWIGPIIAMSLGILPMPYGYYSLLRIIVCGCSLFFVYKSHLQKDATFLWIFGFFAVLYNPLIPIHLYDKQLWIVVNLVTGIIFFLKRDKLNND
jgi:hypothetical protein